MMVSERETLKKKPPANVKASKRQHSQQSVRPKRADESIQRAPCARCRADLARSRAVGPGHCDCRLLSSARAGRGRVNDVVTPRSSCHKKRIADNGVVCLADRA